MSLCTNIAARGSQGNLCLAAILSLSRSLITGPDCREHCGTRPRDFTGPSPPPTRRPCTTTPTILTMTLTQGGSPARGLQSIAWLFTFYYGSGASKKSPILGSSCAPPASRSSCCVSDASSQAGCYPLFREALGFAPCGLIFLGSDRT